MSDTADTEENVGLLRLDDQSSSTSPPSLPPLFNNTVSYFNYRHQSLIQRAKTLLFLLKIHWLSNWRPYIISFAWFLVPSFIQAYYGRDGSKPTKIHPTAYLDGMRGVAAVIVYFYHHGYQCYQTNLSWGAQDSNYNFLMLPLVRLLYGGPPAVALFFVISGYALSYRPLKLIRSQNTKDFSTAITSLVFRRLIRLFAPVMISTFAIYCLIRIGAFDRTREFAADKTYFRLYSEHHPETMPDAWVQFKDWAWHVFTEVHVFGWDKESAVNEYDQHLWTIPIEYRGSLYLFLVLVGTARLRTIWRCAAVFAVMAVAFRHSRWDFMLFLSGAAIAEWDLIRGAHDPVPLFFSEKLQFRFHWKKTALWTLMSVLGLYLMSYPTMLTEDTPGWLFLHNLVPIWWEARKYHLWTSAGAVTFTLAVSHLPWWQRIFSSSVIQYFGRISFALYLIHGPVTHVAGYHIQKLVWGMTGVEGRQYDWGFVLGICASVPVIIWAADLFWRAVDVPTVRFAKWLESRLSVDNVQGSN